MPRYGRWGIWQLCLSVAAGTLATPPAWAEDRFVDTRSLTRHRGEELPAVVPWSDILTATPLFPLRHDRVAPYAPAFDAVAARRSPLSGLAGYTGVASTATVAVRAGAKVDDTAAGAALRSDKANGYYDGGGSRIGFGYERDTEYLVARHGHPETGTLSLGAVRDVFEDTKLPQYSLDVTRLEQSAVKLQSASRPLAGWFDTLQAEAGWSSLTVDADNFSWRAPGTVLLHVPITSQQLKGAATVVRERNGARTELGADVLYGFYNSKRENWEYGTGAITSYRLPAVETVRAGASAAHRLTAGPYAVEGGLRYDLVSSSAQDVHQTPSIPGAAGASYNFSPQQLYERTYGTVDNDAVEHNVSARLRGERRFDGGTAWLDLSRLVRTADHGERWYAQAGPSTLYQVGNPQIAPEKHHKAELGGQVAGGGFKGYGLVSPAGAWRLTARGATDWVEDFITVDRARSQQGILVTQDRAIVYRNVDAMLHTAVAELEAMPRDWLGLRVNVAASRGRNVTDHRPLYQIDPLEANVFVDTFGGDADLGWNLGVHARLVAGQHRVDESPATGAGMDYRGATGGFATFDLYGGLRLGERLAVAAGIENLLDKLYHEHVAGMPQSATTTTLNAPGRTAFIRAAASF